MIAACDSPSRMMRRRITLRNSGTAWRDGYKSDRHRSADKLQSGFHHRTPFGEIIDGADRGMNEIMEAAVNGAIFGAGVTIWLVAGYLIQRLASETPNRTTQPSLRHLQPHRCCWFRSSLYWYSISDNRARGRQSWRRRGLAMAVWVLCWKQSRRPAWRRRRHV